MSLLNDILNRYAGGTNSAVAVASVSDFDHVAQNVPPEVLGKGVAAALNSDQTPAAGSLVSQMFGASSPAQRAGMLNQLISGLGSSGAGILGSLLGHAAPVGQPITPGQAASIDPTQVENAVTQAQQVNPNITDTLGNFYAQHPTLVKTLGGAALAIALGRISQHMRG